MFGLGFYELRDVNLEREMIHCLLWDLTISGLDRHTIAPEPASAKKPSPLPILIPSMLVTVDSHLSTSSDPHRRTLHIPRKVESYPPIPTSRLTPLTSHLHSRLVPRRRLTKTRVLHRH